MYSRISRFAKRFAPARDDAGFTLVEIIVMLAILTIGVLGTLAVATLAVNTSEDNERRTVATNLAREGVELVRAVRDSNWAAESEGSGADCWNYYAETPQQAQAVPYTNNCSQVFAAGNYAVYPNVGNGMPYMERHGTSNTKNAVFRLCRNGTTGLFQPSSASCGSGGTYFRRVAISVGKNLGTDVTDGKPKASYRIRSYVTWPDNDTPDIVVEEYVTDWRKFR